MASTDAKPVPQKNVAYRVTFPIMDADGDLVTGATGLDSEISKDGGTFADCTNEATEIATSSGVYYLDLTSTEMNADTVAIIVKTSSSGAKTTTIVMYPEEAGDIRVNVTQFGSTNGTFASGRPEVNTSHIAGSAVSTSSAQIGVNVVNAGGTAWGSGAITAASIASGALTSAKFAANALDAVWSTATRLLTAGTNIVLAKGTGITGFNDLDAAGIRSAVGLASANTDTQLAAIKSDTAAVKTKTDQITFGTANRVNAQVYGMETDTITSGAVASSAVTELQSGLATAANLAIVDTVVDAIQAKTDNLPSDPADASVVAGLIAGVDAKVDIIDSNVDAILVDTDTTIPAQIAALNNISTAQVNAEMVDVLTIDTYAEPGQAAPPATASLKDKISYLYKAFRNKITQTDTQFSLYADDGVTVDQKATTSDDGTVFTRGEISSGP